MVNFWNFKIEILLFGFLIFCQIQTAIGQPTITLFGKDTIRLERCHSYIDPGYFASSPTYGDLTGSVKVTSIIPFDSIILGTYYFKYSLTDPGNNVATPKYRVVIVTADTTPPTLVVSGPDTIVREVTSSPLTPFPVQSVISVYDACNYGSVVNDGGTVTSNIVGLYKITYSVSDYSGNTTKVYRWVRIIDTIAPVITLFGTPIVFLNAGDQYVDLGATVIDNYWTTSVMDSLLKVSGHVDSSRLGTYHLIYDVTDPSGNKAKTVIRTVRVIDSIPPVIVLNSAQFDSVNECIFYNDPGVNVSDNYDSPSKITITKSGTFYAKFPDGRPTRLGVYTIIYTATDSSGNKSTVTRIVEVSTISPLTISMKGPLLTSVCRWADYKDSGYTLSYPCEDSSGIKVDTFGSFTTSGGTSNTGSYFLRYKATDKTGNSSYSETRNIYVIPNYEGNCLSGINQTLRLENIISIYPNPGNGIFNIVNLSNIERKLNLSVNDALGQQINLVNGSYLLKGEVAIDLSNQPDGIYFITLTSGEESMTKKIILNRL